MTCDYEINIRGRKVWRCKKEGAPFVCLKGEHDQIAGWLCEEHADQVVKLNHDLRCELYNYHTSTPV